MSLMICRLGGTILLTRFIENTYWAMRLRSGFWKRGRLYEIASVRPWCPTVSRRRACACTPRCAATTRPRGDPARATLDCASDDRRRYIRPPPLFAAGLARTGVAAACAGAAAELASATALSSRQRALSAS